MAGTYRSGDSGIGKSALSAVRHISDSIHSKKREEKYRQDRAKEREEDFNRKISLIKTKEGERRKTATSIERGKRATYNSNEKSKRTTIGKLESEKRKTNASKENERRKMASLKSKNELRKIRTTNAEKRRNLDNKARNVAKILKTKQALIKGKKG